MEDILCTVENRSLKDGEFRVRLQYELKILKPWGEEIMRD